MPSLRSQIDPQMLEKIRPEFQGNISIIEKEFQKAGLPVEFTAGALINVWHESGFNHKIRSGFPGEDSVGLFQLNIVGAGKGMVLPDGTDLRMDPVKNTRRIIEEVQSNWGDAMREAYASGDRRVSTYAGLFCRDIERPAYRPRCAEMRGPTALKFFPSDSVKGPFPKWIIYTGVSLLSVYAIGALAYLYLEDADA